MPINLGFFLIRKPRVSQYNAVTTIPPTSSGTYTLKPSFKVSYVVSGTISAVLSITGTKLLTLINDTLDHVDNLSITVLGKNIQEIVDEINVNAGYHAEVLTLTSEDLCLLEGVTGTSINNTYYTGYYNHETEYMINTEIEGKIGSCSISYKENNFKYSGENGRWMIDDGYILDSVGVPVQVDGTVDLGDSGVNINFFPSVQSSDKDISRSVLFKDSVLAQSTDTDISEIVFPAAPIIVENTLELKIDNQVKEEGLDYIIDFGVTAELRSILPSPYTFDASDNIFRVRHNSDAVQEYILPIGTFSAKELADVINIYSIGYFVYAYTDVETNLEYFSIKADRGTSYHQIRIEDGSANSALGYTNYLSANGDSNGRIIFLKHVPNEDLTPTDKTSDLLVKASSAVTDNPFLGVYKDTFVLNEDGVNLVSGKDYTLGEGGDIQLIESIPDESLLSGILTPDNSLFSDNYVVYDNGKIITEGADYRVNLQGGWITLLSSAFPDHVYSIDYKNKTNGVILGEVLLGKRANLDSNIKSPYSVTSSKNTLKVSVNNGDEQVFSVTVGNGITAEAISSLVNDSATGFEAYQSSTGVLSLRTLKYGPDNAVTVLDGSLNSIVGFTDFISSTGSGALGGEQSLETQYSPIEISGFTAPSGGDTIIIKNKDVTGRYSKGTVIKLLNDYYQVRNTYLELRANIINSVSEPYTIIENSNDTFKFTIDNEVETTVVFDAGKAITVEAIFNKINSIRGNSCKLIYLNGIKKIQIIGSSSVIIGNGSLNRTLGFENNVSDTNTPDTFIFMTSFFKNTYVNPVMYTTVNEVIFKEECSSKKEVPQNTNEIVVFGDVAFRYQQDILIRLNNKYFYTVKSSVYEKSTDETLVTLSSKLDIHISKDTNLSYTENPVILEGSKKLKTNISPILTEPFILSKNNNTLTFEEDYTITNVGDITLVNPILNGDDFKISYFGQRYIEGSTPVFAKYSYFDFLKKGSNIQISYQADFPDNFYVNVIHSSTLMDNFKKQTTEKMKQTANLSSSGISTGEIPVIVNSDGGNSSYETTIGDIDDSITLSQTWYNFFDKRIEYFEEEKRLLKGFRIGAEDGRLTQVQLEDSANNPPTRLYQIPDTRLDEEKAEPMRLPCLFGQNSNDLGDSASGWYDAGIFKILNDELSKENSEKTNLNRLLLKSITSGSVTSSGNFDIVGSEQMTVYIEKNSSGSLIQESHVVNFTEKFNYTPDPVHRANNASEIVADINSQVGVTIAFTSGTNVSLISDTNTPCIFVVSDAGSIGFGDGADASIRSRSTWWTGGYTYTTPVPGDYSVHLDIVNQNSLRNENMNNHTDQIQKLRGVMEEWISPSDISFNPAKEEIIKSQNWISSALVYSNDSESFDEIKSIANGNIFTSIDNDSVLTSRISVIDSRISEIMDRIAQVEFRYLEVENLLVSENLFEQRYSWLTFLTHRSNGYYPEKKRTMDYHNQNLRESANSSVALGSMDLYV